MVFAYYLRVDISSISISPYMCPADQHVKEVARELVKNIPSYDEEIQVRYKCYPYCKGKHLPLEYKVST